MKNISRYFLPIFAFLAAIGFYAVGKNLDALVWLGIGALQVYYPSRKYDGFWGIAVLVFAGWSLGSAILIFRHDGPVQAMHDFYVALYFFACTCVRDEDEK